MKRAIFIGQAMPRHKSSLHDWPSLNVWLFDSGITESEIKENFFYSALVDYFPGSVNGSHRVPSGSEILAERDRLKKTMLDFEPKVVVPVGRLSIAYCLNQPMRPLTETIGKVYRADPYGLVGEDRFIVPLPHPSGASTWHRKESNRRLLDEALERLRGTLQ